MTSFLLGLIVFENRFQSLFHVNSLLSFFSKAPIQIAIWRFDYINFLITRLSKGQTHFLIKLKISLYGFVFMALGTFSLESFAGWLLC